MKDKNMSRDADLTALFEAYNPTLPSDSLFMQRLQNKLNTVEIVKSHTERMRQKNRYASVIAVITGFIMGITCTIFYNTIYGFFNNVVSEISAKLPLTDMFTNVLSATVIGALILTVTYFTFDIISGIVKDPSTKATNIR